MEPPLRRFETCVHGSLNNFSMEGNIATTLQATTTSLYDTLVTELNRFVWAMTNFLMTPSPACKHGSWHFLYAFLQLQKHPQPDLAKEESESTRSCTVLKTRHERFYNTVTSNRWLFELTTNRYPREELPLIY
ncbi:hypothetical protein CHS0354_030302 [Potamilus streckersoni]|uniref:Uncharacterized protein n=1 Tax=Potamilus streckersoni TaxID=2493646 RepID=A0AAE0T445_9BIVA|nr:hypothetical protein CHS0354_030302 [Potamilus streckersoni]